MSTFNRPRLITPPKEEEEAYPYRRAWQSIVVESGLLIIVTVTFLITRLLGIEFPQSLRMPINLTVALLPVVLWLIFSYWRERFAIEPRQHLFTVFIISALAANAIGLPVIQDLIQVDSWLALEPAINRIVGYALTVGIIQELLKYLVVRYTVWPRYYRARFDGIAYGAAGAIGYTMVLNLQYALDNPATPDMTALRVLSITTLHIVTSAIIAYSLSESLFNTPSLTSLPLSFLTTALLTGIVIPMHSGLINATFTKAISINSTRPILGIGFSIAFFAVSLFLIFFLFRASEKRAKEAAREQQGYQL